MHTVPVLRSPLRLHLVIVGCLAFLPTAICAEDSDEADKARIDAVKEFPDWRKQPLTGPQLAQCLRDLRSGDREIQKAALETLALARPTPELRDQVYNAASPVGKQLNDRFSRAMVAQINACWTEAESAAKLLRQARRSGGLRFLRRVIEQGNRLQQIEALSALGYSEDPGAAAIIVEHFKINPGVAGRALAILGPSAAPEAEKLIKHADWTVRKDGCEVLRKIGTAAQIPALQELEHDANLLVKNESRKTIEVIRARPTADSERR